jgi:predicted aminopeptidase
LKLPVAVAMLCLLAGCSHVGYYLQAIGGQFEILKKRKPVAEVVADPSTPVKTRDRLALAVRIREFASRELKLPDNESYRSYSALDRPFVLWNVFATPELSNTLTQWCFPVAGCINYRGYFDKGSAEAFAATLAPQGYDVYVGGVPAYSTLGWFDDPILSTFLHYPEVELARLLFHELAHQVVYVKDDSTFNESFATAVEEEGVRRWIAAAGSDKLKQDWLQGQQRRRDFQHLVLEYRGYLEELYATASSDDEKRKRKAEILSSLHDAYLGLKATWGGFSGYDRWFAQRPNNAHIASIAIYTQLAPSFHAMLHRARGDLQAFYLQVKQTAKLAAPERHAYFDGLDGVRSCNHAFSFPEAGESKTGADPLSRRGRDDSNHEDALRCP